MNYNIMIPIYIFIIISIIVLLISIWFIIRSNKTYKFRIYIIDMCYKHTQDYFNDIDWDADDWEYKNKICDKACSLYDQIVNKYEYDEMLYSIKPLRLDKWFTKEEVNFIVFGILK